MRPEVDLTFAQRAMLHYIKLGSLYQWRGRLIWRGESSSVWVLPLTEDQIRDYEAVYDAGYVIPPTVTEPATISEYALRLGLGGRREV